MGLERELYEFWSARRGADGAPWFRPAARQELLADPASSAMVASLGAPFGPSAPGAMLLALRSLDVLAGELEPRLVDAEFVATLPPGFSIRARPTSQAVVEMVDGAAREVIALGYEISDTGLLQRLAAAAGRAVDVTFICDRERAAAQRILETWPGGLPAPAIYQNRARTDARPFASMHSKSVLVDGCDLLLTSANLTFHGLNENIEFGVRLRGGIATEARRLFREILESGILERVR